MCLRMITVAAATLLSSSLPLYAKSANSADIPRAVASAETATGSPYFYGYWSSNAQTLSSPYFYGYSSSSGYYYAPA